MKIFVTGDIHQEDLYRFSLLKRDYPELTKDDVVIVCGDFGIPWNYPDTKGYKTDLYNLEKINGFPWTTVFVDGNHENFDVLETLPETEIFGNTAHKLADSVFHLKRGLLYNIGGKSFLALGGASSIDKQMRLQRFHQGKGKIWWEQELWTARDETTAWQTLELCDYVVDYVISHTCPSKIQEVLMDRISGGRGFNVKPIHDPVGDCLDAIHDELRMYSKWFFGHYHVDEDLDDFVCLYQEIRRIL